MEVRREGVAELAHCCCRGRSSPKEFTPGFDSADTGGGTDRELDEARQDTFD